MAAAPIECTAAQLIDRHGALLLDAYGVLVDGHGALEGARELIAELRRRGKPWCVLTNDASRLPETFEARFDALGLPIARERVVSAGDLVGDALRKHGLAGADVVVLGTSDARCLVERAGARLVDPKPGVRFDALVLADEAGYPLLQAMEAVLSGLFRSLDAGKKPVLLLPNPDVLYPKSEGEYGLAAGSLAMVLERGLELRYPGADVPRFEVLGKPHRAIFEAALARVGTRDAVMVGDQLATDVRGANGAGIASALVTRGLTHTARAMDFTVSNGPPTYLVSRLV